MDPETSSNARAGTACVVLIENGRETDPTLRADLEQRGWRISTQHDPITAMAELCLRERVEQCYELGENICALVVVQPDAWPQWPAMRDALRRFLPGITLLEHRDGVMRILEMPPPLPAATNGPARPRTPLPGAEDEPAAPASITRDELEMLLQGPGGDDR